MRPSLTLFVVLVLAALTILSGQNPTQLQIHLFDRQGNVLRTVGDPGGDATLSLSPDNTRVAIARSGDIWVFDLKTGARTQLTSTPTTERQPTWSPDSRHIAYESQRAGTDSFYRKSSDGTGQEELLYAIGPVTMNLTGWSPDGRFLAYYGGRSTDLWVLSLADRKAIELMNTPFAEVGARISPDSRFIAYRSNESGADEVYVRQFDPASGTQPLNASAKWKVSDKGSVGMVRWRNDGREMYYLASDGGVMAVEITTSPSFSAGTPKALFHLPPRFPLAGQPGRFGDVSGDGKHFAFMVPVGD